ncbi:hypothetical protein OSJ57_17595 [Sphingomonas sp. HH69]
MMTAKAPEALSVETVPGDMSGRILIYFDGIEIQNVTAYNTDAGWVDAVLHDEQGEIAIEGEEIVIRRLHGRVVARLKAAR